MTDTTSTAHRTPDASREPVPVAVVGLGWWGSTIIDGLQDNEHLRVIRGVDVDQEQCARVGDRFGIPTTSSLADALEDDEVRAVVLCSPHPLHLEQIVQAAEAGKHVFCEKPFSVNSGDARTALAAIKAAGVGVGIGHERRFEPAVQQLQNDLRTGVLGVPLVFEGNFSQDKFLSLPPDNWRLSSSLAPVGPLSATGIHLVDLAISMFGAPAEVHARLGTLATGFANGDTLVVTIGFESGSTAVITAVLTTPFIGRVCVMGSEGWTEIRDRNHPEKSMGWDVTTVLRGGEPRAEYFPPFPSVVANLQAFADSVNGGASYPVATSDIQLNVDTFEAISRSAASGKLERLRR
ncbi:Gfo/Idh/MocA family oxidoreductase [Allobranchiibius sp. GilTou38]|uniref:Gfo/Idh/MocA family protein n=1 Tax=Allobranchiibius sp. GilTou38 TaxID=2815210 RepID=UPI001AA19F56|nr:Gfo/Idh/MocA family oxidoreductase [Allobranchiibius sp. GilTou38]MBO1766746.1 Gfo/Idh/MocA family oxidoreductase [Allobranchiibius sp. GilTou38]